MTIIKQKEIPE